MLRVLVCGGRRFHDYGFVWDTLDDIRFERGAFSVVIDGMCPTGVDRDARRYAAENGITLRSFRPDWHQYGRKAGPVRNQRMLDEGRPDLVVAFPGGRGTADMVRRAKRAGVEVIEVDYYGGSDAETTHDR